MNGTANSSKEVVCCFCRDINGPSRSMRPTKEGFVNQICRATENFVTFPSLSPVAAGHTLIAPRRHLTSIVQIDEGETEELVGFICQVAQSLLKTTGEVYLFEHGIGLGQEGGCGVTHAHLHLVGLSDESASRVVTRIRSEHEVRTLSNLRRVGEVARQGDTYIMFGPVHGPVDIAVGVSVPSQYLRRLVAEAQGSDRWDWRDYFGWDRFAETRRLLSAHAVDASAELAARL